MNKWERYFENLVLVGCLIFFAGLALFASKVEGGLFNSDEEAKVVELHIHRTQKQPLELSKKARIQTMPLSGDGVCSGFFISPFGDIMTAKHCTERADSIVVVTSDNQSYLVSQVIQSPSYDLALIRIGKQDTPYFRLASSAIRGETIYALGSPLAVTNTLSKGIIAKLDGDKTLMDLSIIPGNSGCPVFNDSGRLVGVAVAVYIVGFGTSHLSIAQSLESVKQFLEENTK